MASRDSPSGSGEESGALSSLVRLSRYPLSVVVVVVVVAVAVDGGDDDEVRALCRCLGDGPTNAITLVVEQMVNTNTAPASEKVAYFDRC